MLSCDFMECTECTEWINAITNKYGKCESLDSYNKKEQKV